MNFRPSARMRSHRLLSEARKFALHFCLANQFTDQLSNAVRSAVIGNAGTLVVFRVGSRDAELLAPEFRPMDAGALADQEPFTAWLRRGIGRDRIFVEPQALRAARHGRRSSASRAGSGSADRAARSNGNVKSDSEIAETLMRIHSHATTRPSSSPDFDVRSRSIGTFPSEHTGAE